MLLIVLKIYIRFYGAGLHKIQFNLKQEHNVEISHQSIENILLKSNYEFDHENWSYSGYYLLIVFGLKLMVYRCIFWRYLMLN